MYFGNRRGYNYGAGSFNAADSREAVFVRDASPEFAA